MTEQRKAKRRLTNFNFSGEGAHVALVAKEQGGAANGWHEAIVMKATSDVSDEFLEKATMVKVTLPFDDFLEKFFGMYSEDADVLTEILGFSDEEADPEMSGDMNGGAMSWEEYQAECEKEKQDFINSVEILKSIKNGEKSLNALDAKSYLSVLLTQSLFEEHQADIEKAVNTSKEKKVQVEQELQKAKDAIAAKDVEIQKAIEQMKAVQEELNVLKAASAKAKDDSRMAALKDVVSDEEAASLFKSLNVLDDEGFANVIKSLALKAEKEAELFKEKGVSTAGEKPTEDPVARILKAKFNTQESQ